MVAIAVFECRAVTLWVSLYGMSVIQCQLLSGRTMLLDFVPMSLADALLDQHFLRWSRLRHLCAHITQSAGQ